MGLKLSMKAKSKTEIEKIIEELFEKRYSIEEYLERNQWNKKYFIKSPKLAKKYFFMTVKLLKIKQKIEDKSYFSIEETDDAISCMLRDSLLNSH